MHFAAAAVFAAITAVVLQLFGKIADFAQVQLGGVDVLVITIQYDYGYTLDTKWQDAFAHCLDHTFFFGVNESDSRFASGCSATINTLRPMLGDLSLWNRKNMTIRIFYTCPVKYGNESYKYPEIKRYLEKFKSDFFAGHRNLSSVVTFLFADKNLKNDIDSENAKWFVDWPNQLFLVLMGGYAGKEADLAKNGIALNHLLNFTVGQCPEFTKYLQHLLCHDEDEAPTTLFSCKETSAGSENCTEGKQYKASKLLKAETICAEILVDEIPCDCPTSSTVDSLASSPTTAKYDDNEIMSYTVIAGIVIGLIVVLLVTTGLVWFFACRRPGGSSGPVGAAGGSRAGAGAGDSQAPASQLAEDGASQKSASKPQKSASKQPQKTAKSVVGSQSKTGGTKVAKLGLEKK